MTTGSGDTAVVTLEFKIMGYVFAIVYVKADLPSGSDVFVFAKFATAIKGVVEKVAKVARTVVVSL